MKQKASITGEVSTGKGAGTLRTAFTAITKFLALPIKTLRAVFNTLSKPVVGHPLLTWVITALTLVLFAVEGNNEGASKFDLSTLDFWSAVGWWAFAAIIGPIVILVINRQTEGISPERRAFAARFTASVQLIWLGVTILVWALNVSKFQFGSLQPAHGLLGSLLLLPSFSLNLILLQLGLRDKGLEANVILANKTGTLTTGRRKLAFIQIAVNSPLKTKDEVLALAAGLEPEELDDLSKAIRDRAKRRKIKPAEVKDVMQIVGLGMAGRLDGSRVVLGGPAQLVSHNTKIDVADLVRADQANTQGQTVLYLLIDGELCGYLGFADQVRNDVKFFIELLQYRRRRVIVYSGDAHETTKYVANQLECDAFYGEVLPHEFDNMIKKITSDGSVIIETNDIEATALQIERAIRDRRLQWATIVLSLVLPAIGLGLGILKVINNEKPGILGPAIFATFGLISALTLIIYSQSTWHRVPKTISAATLDEETDDD